LLSYIDDEAYRRRILIQLNKGESRHSLAPLVFRPLHRPIECPLPSIEIYQQNALDPLELNSTLPQPGAPLLPLAGDEARGQQEEPPAYCTSRRGSLVQYEPL